MTASHRYIFAAALLCTLCAISDDDVKYRAKEYSGRKLDNKSYRAKAYRTEKSARNKKFKSSPGKSGGFWSMFGFGKTKKYDKLPVQKVDSGKDYHRDERISLKVEPAQDKELPDQDNLGNTTAFEDKKYTPGEKKPGKNPLLTPRTGIKAPLVKEKK